MIVTIKFVLLTSGPNISAMTIVPIEMNIKNKHIPARGFTLFKYNNTIINTEIATAKITWS